MSQFTDAAGSLATTLKTLAGESITYARDGVGSVSLTAAIGRTERSVFGSDGLPQLEYTDRDFLIKAEDLVIASVTRTPQRGDRITQGSSVFEVLPIGGGDCYRNSDIAGLILRVHTKRVA